MANNNWTTPYLQIPPDALTPDAKPQHDRFDVHISGMRIHELAVNNWLNQRFIHLQGYPMPLVLSKPMNAYADYKQIWAASEGNAFKYLLDAKDSEGRPLYQPHPAPPPYPLLSLNRVRWAFAPQRNFGSQTRRHGGWVDASKNVPKNQLATVRQQRMPQAWDYHFQLDHYSITPEQQAHFIQELSMGWYPSASVPNTWIVAVYPNLLGRKLIRVVLEGDIVDSTEVEPAEGYRVYRTTVNLLVEGWHADPDFVYVNAFWREVENAKAVAPKDLDLTYQAQWDLRPLEQNGIFDTAPNMPPAQPNQSGDIVPPKLPSAS